MAASITRGFNGGYRRSVLSAMRYAGACRVPFGHILGRSSAPPGLGQGAATAHRQVAELANLVDGHVERRRRGPVLGLGRSLGEQVERSAACR
jgi:hypothetical protein